MSDADPGAITLAELREPPRIHLRRLPELFWRGLRLVWAAGPRELVLVLALQAAGGLGLALPILAGRDLLAEVLHAAGTAEPTGVLLRGAAVVVLLGTLNLAATVAAARDEILSELVNRHAQRRILDVACSAPLERMDLPAFHNRLERAATSAGMRPHQLVQGLGALAQALMGTVGVALAVAAIEPLLAMMTLLAGVPLWLAGVRSGQIVFAMFFRLTPAERERSYLLQLLTSRQPAAEVRAFGLARYLRGRWERRTGERLDEVRRTVRAQLRITLAARLAGGAVLGAVLAMLAGLVLTGRMTTADAAAAAGAVLLLGSRLRTAAAGTDQLFEAAPFLEDLRAFVEPAPAAAPRASVPAPAGFRVLRVEDVTFTYPSGARPALRAVDLELRAGEVVALVGENGSGKTTLAKLLAGLYRPQAGRVLWDGADLADLDGDQLRGSIALLLQDFQRYLLPAADNVAVGRWQQAGDRAAVVAAARLAGADRHLAALPSGYDTLLGPEFVGGTDLSGGQWQRVALARTFFRDAPFVILDEPTATLDARAEHELFDRVRTLLTGRTVLLISHRFSTVRSADRIYVLADGRVVEHGTHDELLAADGRYAELFTLQASGYLDQPQRR